METEIIQWLLSLWGASILACWIAYQSTLVQDIKRLLGLSEEQKLPKWKPWFKPIGFIVAEIKSLSHCPYCISFWLGLFVNLLLWHITLPLSILYAMLSVVGVEVYRKISL